MTYTLKRTNQFRKDFKCAAKRGYNMNLIADVIGRLSRGETLEPRFHDHELKTDYAGMRECHITPDWLLVYFIEDEVLVLTLTRTGSHSDLF